MNCIYSLYLCQWENAIIVGNKNRNTADVLLKERSRSHKHFVFWHTSADINSIYYFFGELLLETLYFHYLDKQVYSL